MKLTNGKQILYPKLFCHLHTHIVNLHFIFTVEKADVIIFFCGHVYHERCVNKRNQVNISVKIL